MGIYDPEQMVRDRAKGMTLEALAEKYGVSQKQVRMDLGEATWEGSQVELPAKIKGKDGKERPAKYKPRKPKAETPAVAANTVGQTDGKACRPFRCGNPRFYHAPRWMRDFPPSMGQKLESQHQTDDVVP